jgi:Neuraminidase (sialidase)
MSNSAYMVYYEHLAKLGSIANKQTLFLGHLLFYAEYDSALRQNVVELTPYRKRSIMTAIGSTSKNLLSVADHYLLKICKSGLIKGVGNGMYLIDPKSFGLTKYIKKELRNRSAIIYETRVFTEQQGSKVVSSYLIDEDGVKHQIVEEQKEIYHSELKCG